MLVLHCFVEILMEVNNGVEDEGLRLKTKEENQEKKSLGTAQRQKYTVGRANARRWHQGRDAWRFCDKRQTARRHKCDAGRLPVGLGPVFCCAPQL